MYHFRPSTQRPWRTPHSRPLVVAGIGYLQLRSFTCLHSTVSIQDQFSLDFLNISLGDTYRELTQLPEAAGSKFLHLNIFFQKMRTKNRACNKQSSFRNYGLVIQYNSPVFSIATFLNMKGRFACKGNYIIV